MPALREGTVRFPVLQINTSEDVDHASEQVLRQMGLGKCTPGQAEKITAMLEVRRKVLETVDLDKRVRRIEEKADATLRKD